jgi:hypothetical protein
MSKIYKEPFIGGKPDGVLVFMLKIYSAFERPKPERGKFDISCWFDPDIFCFKS